MDLTAEVIGWFGAVLVLGAYLQAARGIWPASGLASAAANLTGAAFLSINGWYHGALPSVGLNLVWMSIGVLTLLRVSRRAREPDDGTGPGSSVTSRVEHVIALLSTPSNEAGSGLIGQVGSRKRKGRQL